jgi:phosphoglycolate phosphatase-like HAD superfamily hydrolase
MEYKKLARPIVVALDLDRTLHDVIEVYQSAFNLTRQHFGYNEMSVEEIEDLHKESYKPTSEVFKATMGENAEAALAYYYDTLHMRDIAEDYVLPGAREMLEGLKKYNIPIVAVTNSEQHIAKKILRDVKLYSMFDSITGVKPGRNLKPNPELLILGLAKIKQEPSKNVWFMGDDKTDTLCAKITGCTGIRYYRGDKPEDPNADALFSCHFEFLAAIEYFYRGEGSKEHNS